MQGSPKRSCVKSLKFHTLPRVVWVHVIETFLNAIDLALLRGTCTTFRGWFAKNEKIAKFSNFLPDRGLHEAALLGDDALVDLFLGKGATRFQFGMDGAARNGHLSLLKKLHDRMPSYWPTKDAAFGGHASVIEWMDEHKESHKWHGGLFGAVKTGSLARVKQFVKLGASDYNATSWPAGFSGNEEVFDFLSEHGHINLLQYVCGAAFNGRAEYVKNALDSGIWFAAHYYTMALHAMAGGNLDLVEFTLIPLKVVAMHELDLTLMKAAIKCHRVDELVRYAAESEFKNWILLLPAALDAGYKDVVALVSSKVKFIELDSYTWGNF